MPTTINYLDANTKKRSNCADHSQIDFSSKNLSWEGLVVEKGSIDYFTPKNIITEEFYFAMLLNDDLNWNVEKNKEDSSIYSQANDIWVNPPFTPFSTKTLTSITYLNVLISKELLFKHYNGNIQTDEIEFLRDYNVSDNFISHMMFLLLEEVINHGANGPDFLSNLLALFSNYFINNYSNISCFSQGNLSSSITDTDLARLDQYILEHIYSPITITELASVVHMSKYQLLNNFKMKMSVTPYQYILSLKIDIAKKLLLSSNDSLIDIALSLGFNDSSHFTHTFKKHTNQTPTQYRANKK